LELILIMLYSLTGILASIALVSFVPAPQEGLHLITGTWALTKAEPNAEIFTRGLMLEQVYFGSAGAGGFFMKKKNADAVSKFLFHMIPAADSLSELCVVKCAGNGGFGQIVFRVTELTKRNLTLKLESKDSARFFQVPNLMQFERIAGPPENME